MCNLKLIFKDHTARREIPEDDQEEVDDCFEVGNDSKTRPNLECGNY